jgi:hypothetical protein
MYTNTAMNANNTTYVNTSNSATSNSATGRRTAASTDPAGSGGRESATTRAVRRSGTAIPAYFLGRHRDRWVAALAPSTVEAAIAA